MGYGHKLVLGTAGLGGQPYGLEKRVVAEPDAIKLLQHARDCGITRFDTAPAYGNAEAWLGRAMQGKAYAVSTKTSGDIDIALRSAERLATDNVRYLWHNWTPGKGPQTLPDWVHGLTMYGADHFNGPSRDRILQMDWNLLQQWMPNGGHKSFIARSVFLQGQLTEAATPRDDLAPLVDRARRIAAVLGVDLTTLALRAALEHLSIDYVLIGPTTLDELDLCMEIAERSRPIGAQSLLPLLHADAPAVDPRTWAAA